MIQRASMRLQIRATAAALALVGATGCLDLQEEVISGVTTSYFETEAGLTDALDATYSTLRDVWGSEPGAFLSTAGTDIYGKGTQRPHFFDYTPGLNPSDGLITNLWNDLYWGINTANAMIGRSAEVEMPVARRDQLVAEARFLRGLYYFQLVQTFGDVHLTLEETVGVMTETTRAPRAKVYEAIVADLQFAVANLPVTQSEYGRATRGAAQHFLSKVYLTRAAQGDLARAAELGKQVIDSGRYRLLDSYASVFDINNQQNPEVVFPVRYSGDPLSNGSGNQWHLYWLSAYDEHPGLSRSIEYGRPFQRFRPTPFLLNLFDRQIDTRYDATFQTVWLANNANKIPKDASGRPRYAVGDTAIWMPGVELPASVIASKRYQVVPPSRYRQRLFPSLKKHQDPNRATVQATAGTRDIPAARLAETYLNVAEALVRDGKPAEAVPFVNAVRRRAAKPGAEAQMEVTAAQMTLDFLLDERARELAGEGHRWFDLVRTGKLVERVLRYSPDLKAIQPYHTLRPIPQTAIDRTTSEFPQNPGY